MKDLMAVNTPKLEELLQQPFRTQMVVIDAYLINLRTKALSQRGESA